MNDIKLNNKTNVAFGNTARDVILYKRVKELAGDLKEFAVDVENKLTNYALKTDLDSKIDKVNEVNKVYVTDENGNQQIINYTSEAQANSIVKRDENSTFEISSPTSDNNPATKKYVDTSVTTLKDELLDITTNIQTVVDGKLTASNDKNIIYGTDVNGNQQTLAIQKQANAGDGIVQRTGGGHVVVPFIPDAADCATSKQYVDNSLLGKVNASKNKSIIYGTDDKGNQTTYLLQRQVDPDNGSGIVQRTGNGNVVVPFVPAAADCATSKHYVDDKLSTKADTTYVDTKLSEKANQSDLELVQVELNNKLNKVTGETTNTQVYVKNAEGGQDMVDVTSSAQHDTLVRRDDNNLFDVAEPVSEANPTTKKYVDDGLETKMNTFLEVASFLNLPAVGSTSTFYVTVDNNKLYRWTGSAYIEIGNSKVLTTNTPTKIRNYTIEVYNYPYMQSLASDGKHIFGIMSKWAEQGRDIVACSYDLNGNLIATKELNESATLERCCGLTVKDGKLIIFQNGGVEKSVTINADGTFGANWEVYTGFKFAEINSTTPLQDVVYSKNLDRLYVKPYDYTDTVYIYANDASATTNNTLLGTFTLKTINGANFTRMTISDNCVFANYTNNGIMYPLIAVYTIDGKYLYTSNISYTPEEASVGIDFPAGETFDVEHSNTQGILYLNDSIYFTSISFSTGYLGHKSAIVKCTLINDSKQLILGETGSTAYPGNKGKANADNIKRLQETKADITYVDNAIKQAITNILTEEF